MYIIKLRRPITVLLLKSSVAWLILFGVIQICKIAKWIEVNPEKLLWDSSLINYPLMYFSITALFTIISLKRSFLTSGLIPVWILIPLEHPPWWPVGSNECANSPCDFWPSSIYDSAPILPSDNGLQWLIFWRGDFSPSVFDTPPILGYRLATNIYPHLWGSEDVSPNNKVNKKCVYHKG